jgi:D-3-phosphoglycerate dehydrogenase
MKKRVLINAPIDPDDLSRLRSLTEVVGVDQGDIGDRILDYVPFDAIIASAVIPLDSVLFNHLEGLSVIGRLGTGVDNVNLEDATKWGIIVINTPGAPTISTAEHTFALILALAKDIVYQDRVLKHGDWSVRHQRIGRDLYNMTIGLVGFGKIGQRVAQLCAAFGMQIMVFDPYVDKKDSWNTGVEFIHTLQDLLPKVDIISIHAPLQASTHHLFGEPEFKLMQSHAWLINTSRGGLVDEKALIEALKSGRIAAAGLDVFEPEPPSAANPLFRMDNVIVSPHRAFYTQDGLKRLSRSVTDQVLKALRGERPEHIANPEVWNRFVSRL